MKTVVRVKAVRTAGVPSVDEFDAEAMIRDEETRETVYVHVNWFDGLTSFTVSPESLDGFMAEDWDEGADAALFNPDGSVNLASLEELTDDEIDDLLKLTEEAPEDAAPAESPYTEEYMFLEDTRDSAYHEVFAMLDAVIAMMANGVG